MKTTIKRTIKRNTIKRKRQKGGILLKMSSEKAFDTFLQNSEVKLLTDQSSFGIILQLTLNKEIDSPYEMFGPQHFQEPVKRLLVKLVALGPIKEAGEEWPYLDGRSKQIDTEATFQKEVNIQTNIFFKTMNDLEPLCPAPVYANVFKKEMEITDFFKTLMEKARNQPVAFRALSKMKKSFEEEYFSWLGVLGMEIATGYLPLFDFYNKVLDPPDIDYYEWTEQMAKLQILNLALKTGYSQNDFHRGNLLVNPNYEGFYKGLPGKVLIIDFGLASKLTPENIKEIKNDYNQGEFQQALKIFKSLKRSDDLEISHYPAYYGWLYGEDDLKQWRKLSKRSDDYYNSIIGRLIKKEDVATEERTRLFDEKHKEDPARYPYLPLSNQIKNRFYQGILKEEGTKEGGKYKPSKKSLKKKTRKNKSI
jgi:hypothetical protein